MGQRGATNPGGEMEKKIKEELPRCKDCLLEGKRRRINPRYGQCDYHYDSYMKEKHCFMGGVVEKVRF